VSGLTRPATTAELAWVSAPAVRAQIVASASELVALSEREPWRVRVTERGEAAILASWREHLNDCAVLGLWCSPRRVPVVMTDLLEIARQQGFERLLGPLVSEHHARPYLDAGLRVFQRVVVMRIDVSKTVSPCVAPRAAGIRDFLESDLDALVSLDSECFDPFWHYDEPSIRRLAVAGRVAIAVLDGRMVGYTLSTMRAGEASLGRLAVAPPLRRRGIGRMLATEAVAWMAARGARRVLLSTQEDNTAARALYRGMGFDETGDVLVACASGSLTAPVAGESL
jgi:GNAT superfamily N-acetyltransferase